MAEFCCHYYYTIFDCIPLNIVVLVLLKVYLKHLKITNYEDLVKELDRCVQLYNQEKPHIKLNRLSPNQFEKCIFASK